MPVTIAVAALLLGCAQPVAMVPRVDVPTRWSALTQADARDPISRPDWWRNFNDPLLDQLIDDALERNNDLAAAAVRVYQAREQAKLVDTNLSPSLTLGASGSLSASRYTGQQTQSGGIALSASYEVDLWGKLAAQRDASAWEAHATEQDRQSARLAVIATTATLYWQLAYLNRQISLSSADIADATRAVDLAESRHRAGAASALDVTLARLALSNLEAEATQLVQQLAECRRALAIVFDRPPERLAPEREDLPDVAPLAIPAGLPVDLLRNRPDLRAAELRLRASFADVEAARASFYPSLTLTGNMGTSSDTLLQVIRNPVATLGLGLVLPFIEWNTMQHTIKVSQAEYEQAVIQFRQSLYQALSEVENALSARTQFDAQGRYLDLCVAEASRAEALAAARFRAGAASIQPWLDQQHALRDAQRTQLLNRFERLVSQMTLYQALGGGDIVPAG